MLSKSVLQRLAVQWWSPNPFPDVVSPNANRTSSMGVQTRLYRVWGDISKFVIVNLPVRSTLSLFIYLFIIHYLPKLHVYYMALLCVKQWQIQRGHSPPLNLDWLSPPPPFCIRMLKQRCQPLRFSRNYYVFSTRLLHYIFSS